MMNQYHKCGIFNVLVLLLWLLLIPTIVHGWSPPRVEKGVLDLRQWDFKNQGHVRLDGNWLFSWNHLVDPGLLGNGERLPNEGLQKVPGIWNMRVEDGRPVSGDGYATYRLKVLLNPDCCQVAPGSAVAVEKRTGLHAMGLRFMFVETAFAVYVNGRKVSSVGKVGTSAASSRPLYSPHVASFLVDENTLDIVIHVSNFHHRKGGLQSVIRLGCEKAIQESRQKALNIDLFLFGAIFMMAVFYLGVSLLWKNERAPLFFCLLCFVVALRAVSVGEYAILTLFPWIPWEVLLKIEYLTFIWPAALFGHFLVALYPREIRLFPVRVYTGITIATSLVILFLPVRVFSFVTMPFQIMLVTWSVYLSYVLVMAMKRRRLGGAELFVGGIVLFAVGVNDILYNNLILQTGMLLPFGMFIFILMEALVLSRMTADALFTVEKLSNTLDLKVKQRTRELLVSNNQMKQLLHILCHDLQNPLSSIQSIIGLSRDDPKLFSEMAPYASTAVDNGLAIIDLVREIRLLEEKKLSLSLESLPLLELVQESERMLSQKTAAKSITIKTHVDVDIRICVERTSFVNSVLNNILTNAIKFSYPNSVVEISAESKNGTILLSVKDSGIGMSESMVRDLFNLDKSSSRTGTAGETGTGFGMPLVKKFIRAYRGKIEVFSKEAAVSEDHGTEVRMTFNAP